MAPCLGDVPQIWIPNSLPAVGSGWKAVIPHPPRHRFRIQELSRATESRRSGVLGLSRSTKPGGKREAFRYCGFGPAKYLSNLHRFSAATRPYKRLQRTGWQPSRSVILKCGGAQRLTEFGALW